MKQTSPILLPEELERVELFPFARYIEARDIFFYITSRPSKERPAGSWCQLYFCEEEAVGFVLWSFRMMQLIVGFKEEDTVNEILRSIQKKAPYFIGNTPSLIDLPGTTKITLRECSAFRRF